MTALSEADLDRLIKLLGLLSSDHAGERATAGAMAWKYLKDRDLSWPEILTPRLPVPSSCPQCRPSPSFGWRHLADRCLDLDAGCETLTDWEINFLLQVRRRTHRPTPRQAEVLQRIAISVGAR